MTRRRSAVSRLLALSSFAGALAWTRGPVPRDPLLRFARRFRASAETWRGGEGRLRELAGRLAMSEADAARVLDVVADYFETPVSQRRFYSGPDDEALLRGRMRVFEALVQRSLAMPAMRKLDHDARHDLVQDARISMFKAMRARKVPLVDDDGRGAQEVIAYGRVLLRNAVTQGGREARRRASREVPVGMTIEVHAVAPDEIGRTMGGSSSEVDYAVVYRAYALKLSRPMAEVLVLVSEGCSQVRIAELLGLRRCTVRKRMQRSKETLLRLVEEASSAELADIDVADVGLRWAALSQEVESSVPLERRLRVRLKAVMRERISEETAEVVSGMMASLPEASDSELLEMLSMVRALEGDGEEGVVASEQMHRMGKLCRSLLEARLAVDGDDRS